MWAIVSGAYRVNAASGAADPERFEDVEMRPNRLSVRRVTIAMPMSTRTSVASQTKRIRAARGCGEEPMGNISGLPPQVGSRGEHTIDNHVANPRRQRSLWRRGVGVWVVPLPPFVR